MVKIILKTVGLLFVMVLLAGCETMKKSAPGETGEVREPIWAISGGGIYTYRKERVFHGVGMANEYRNLSLLRAFSENRAKEDLYDVLVEFTEALKDGFIKSEKAIGRDSSLNMFVFERDVAAVRSEALARALITDRWLHPGGGKGYSLMSLGLDDFIKAFDESERLDEQFRTYIDENAEDIHDKLGAPLQN